MVKLNYDFYNFYLNGNFLGYYSLEESFGKVLLERNKRRNGPIFSTFEDFSLNCDLLSGSIDKFSKLKLIERKNLKIDQNYTYEKQIDYFFKSLNPNMMNNIFEAAGLFNLIHNVKQGKI